MSIIEKLNYSCSLNSNIEHLWKVNLKTNEITKVSIKYID